MLSSVYAKMAPVFRFVDSGAFGQRKDCSLSLTTLKMVMRKARRHLRSPICSYSLAGQRHPLPQDCARFREKGRWDLETDAWTDLKIGTCLRMWQVEYPDFLRRAGS